MKSQHMTFDPEKPGNLLNAYPHLGDVLQQNEIEIDDSIDPMLRLIAWVYDPASPMITKFPDIRERKKQAAVQSGFMGTVNTEVVVAMLKHVFKNREWTLICSFENTYDELTDRVNQKIEGENDEDIIKAVERKTKLLDHMEKICFKITELKKRFYAEDADLLDAEEANETFSPENVAAMGKR